MPRAQRMQTHTHIVLRESRIGLRERSGVSGIMCAPPFPTLSSITVPTARRPAYSHVRSRLHPSPTLTVAARRWLAGCAC